MVAPGIRSKIFKAAPQISLTEQQWLKRVDDARPDRGVRCECAYADCRSCAIGRTKLKLRTNGSYATPAFDQATLLQPARDSLCSSVATAKSVGLVTSCPV